MDAHADCAGREARDFGNRVRAFAFEPQQHHLAVGKGELADQILNLLKDQRLPGFAFGIGRGGQLFNRVEADPLGAFGRFGYSFWSFI